MNSPINCSRSDSYFASTDFALQSSYISLIVALPLYFYGAFCILKLTPNIMKSAKIPLLVMHFWNVFLDLFMNLIAIPFAFYPTYSIVLLGIGSKIGLPVAVQVGCTQGSVGAQSTAIISLFENRHSQIETAGFRIRRRSTRIFINLFNYFVAVVVVPIPFLKPIDYAALRLELLKVIPCVVPEFFRPDLIIVTDASDLVTVLVAISMIIFCAQGAFYNIHTLYHLVYRTWTHVSQVTRKLQLQLFIGTVLQVTIPLFIMIVPIGYTNWSMHSGYYCQSCNNWVMAALSFHGTLSIMCMILVHKVYRQHLLKISILRVFCPDATRISHVSFLRSSEMNS